MANKKEVKRIIDWSEKRYSRCWDALIIIKEFKNNGFKGNDVGELLNFQIILGETLFKIQEYYEKTKKEWNILKKKRTKSQHDINRLKEIGKYLNILIDLIKIGKSLGDAFVWFFYQKEQEILVHHLQQQDNFHPTIRLGGFGELEFLRRAVKLDNHTITLYHGITNILRIGDVSYFNLKEFKIVGYGELKTQKANDDNCINVKLYTFGDKELMPFAKWDKSNKEDDSKKEKAEEEYFDQERLDRQIERIVETLKLSDEIKSNKLGNKVVGSIKYHDEIAKSLAELPLNHFAHKKVSDGLIITAMKSNRKKLSSIFLKGIADSQEVVVQNDEKFKSLLDEIQYENFIENDRMITPITPADETNGEWVIGSKPLFWEQIDNEVLKGIYFSKIVVLTTYNPIYLMMKIKDLGFVFTLDKKKKLKVTLDLGEYKLRLENPFYFINLAKKYLVSEEAIVDIIRQTVEGVKSKEIKGNTMIKMIINQFALL